MLGHHCAVFTDYSTCLSLLNTVHPSGKLARWALNIQEIDLTIKHCSGKSNSNADALSCNPHWPLLPKSSLRSECVLKQMCFQSNIQLPATSNESLAEIYEL